MVLHDSIGLKNFVRRKNGQCYQRYLVVKDEYNLIPVKELKSNLLVGDSRIVKGKGDIVFREKYTSSVQNLKDIIYKITIFKNYKNLGRKILKFTTEEECFCIILT